MNYFTPYKMKIKTESLSYLGPIPMTEPNHNQSKLVVMSLVCSSIFYLFDGKLWKMNSQISLFKLPNRLVSIEKHLLKRHRRKL
jgi:hypothetical protein